MALTKVRGNTQIKTGTITNVEISANAGIELSKLAEGAELLKRDGSVALTGNLNLDGNKLINVGAPTSNNDGVRKVDLDSAVSSIQSDISGLDNRLDVAESEIDALQAADVVIDGRLDTTESDIVALEGRMDVAESDIVALEAADVVIDGRLDAVELKNTEQDGRLDTAEGDIVALESGLAQEILDRQAGVQEAKDYADQKVSDLVNGAPAVLDTLKELADALGSDENFSTTIAGQIGGLDTRLDTAEADIISLESGLTQEILDRQAGDQNLQDQIDALDGGLSGDLTALENRVTTAEGDIVALEAADVVIDGRLDAVELKNTEQDGRLDTAEADIVALEAADVVIDGRLDAVELKNTEQDGRLDAVELKNTQQDGRLDAVELKNTQQDGRLDALELMKDAQMVYVAKSGNDSTGNGGEHKPFLTIQAAMASISDASASKRYIIKVKGGSYTESGVLNLKANVFIVGEHKDSVRIGATSFGLDSSFSGSADNRSGIANAILLNACDFNWQTVTSAAGKLYFSDVSFSSTVAMYGHNNAIAQAQFHSCMFFNTFTVSGINIGVHRNNIHYGNINLNQHPNGGMATILVADGGVCSGTVKLTTTVNDFSRRCSVFARSFYMEYLTVDGSSSYCDLTDNSVPRDIARMTKPNGGNIVYINTLSPVDSNSRNIGEPGKQYLYNFNYVNASTGTDLYVISMGNAYSADSSGKSIFIESDSYGLNANVNGGDINMTTAAVSGTGVRGKVKIDARELDLNSKKIVNLADGVALSDAVNKGQLDSVSSDLSADITALDGRMTTAEGDIVALEAADVVLDGRLDTAEGDIVALESGLAQEILDRQAGVQEAKDYADQKVADLVDGAPAVLDTLKELADALGSDENFSTTIAGQIGALDTRLDTAEADIVALESADVALDGRLDVAEADIVALESSLGSLDSSVVKLAKVITREIPSGDVDGVNKAFLLVNSVVSDSEHVFLNGLLQEPGVGNDYTISGSTITFETAPSSGDRIRVSYIKQ